MKVVGWSVNYRYLFLEICLILFIFTTGFTCTRRLSKSYCSDLDKEGFFVSDKIYNAANKEFLFWLSGFTDAEGNFSIFVDRGFVRFRFKISLHIDDIETLNTIKYHLNVGIVTSEPTRGRCSYVVNKFADINQVIIPLFLEFPLHTSKRLDFKNFCEAISIKNQTNQKNISKDELAKIVLLKQKMNFKREFFTDPNTKYTPHINPNWLIGFIEGEGTFGIKTGSALYLQIAQNNTSSECLNAIKDFFLHTLTSKYTHDNKILPLNVVSSTNAKTNIVSLVINSVDALYYYVLPYLDVSKMYTRKAIDFKLWRLALLLKIQGHYFTPEGKKLFLEITDILNKRYSTTSTKDIDNIIKDIFCSCELVLAKGPIFNMQHYIFHADNVRKISIASRSENPRRVYIYIEGVMVKGSPFSSYSEAHQALGLNPSSNTCNRYIDTGKRYKNNYIFTSQPLNK